MDSCKKLLKIPTKNFRCKFENFLLIVLKKYQIIVFLTEKSCYSGYVECSFNNRAEKFLPKFPNFFAQSSKIFSNLYCFHKMNHRNEFCEYHFLSNVVLIVIRGAPRSLGYLCSFWKFQPFHFRALSYPPSAENITVLLRLFLHDSLRFCFKWFLVPLTLLWI